MPLPLGAGYSHRRGARIVWEEPGARNRTGIRSVECRLPSLRLGLEDRGLAGAVHDGPEHVIQFDAEGVGDARSRSARTYAGAGTSSSAWATGTSSKRALIHAADLGMCSAALAPAV